MNKRIYDTRTDAANVAIAEAARRLAKQLSLTSEAQGLEEAGHKDQNLDRLYRQEATAALLTRAADAVERQVKAHAKQVKDLEAQLPPPGDTQPEDTKE